MSQCKSLKEEKIQMSQENKAAISRMLEDFKMQQNRVALLNKKDAEKSNELEKADQDKTIKVKQ